MDHDLQTARRNRTLTLGENMCMKTDLETRVVILEAALAWIRHESSARSVDRRAMERIAAIASQVLEDDERTMSRQRAYAAELRAG